jgi:hypothetical protein
MSEVLRGRLEARVHALEVGTFLDGIADQFRFLGGWVFRIYLR